MATMLVLRALTGEMRGLEFAFAAPATVILGRSRSCALRLPGDGTVSRQHCMVEVDDYGVWVQDLGSLNGTFVNGEKVGQRIPTQGDDETMVQPPRHALVDGDELRVCNNLFAVRLTDVTPLPQKRGLTSLSSGEYHIAVCI
ncbi:MAG: FHA domain-containing protein [Gemmataceae bacterium]